MAAFYQTILSLNLAILALAAGGIAGLYQVAASASSPAVARLAVVNRWTVGFVIALAVNFTVALAGSVLLSARHDLVAGANFNVDLLLSAPSLGLGVGVTTIATALLAVAAIGRGSRVLRADESAALLLRGVEPASTERQHSARMEAVVDLARRALREGRVRDYRRIVEALVEQLSISSSGEQAAQTVDATIDAFLLPLAEEAASDARYDEIASISSALVGLARNLESPDVTSHVLRFSGLAAEHALAPAGRRALTSIMADVAELGSLGVDQASEGLFDTACVTLGGLGERIPTTFLRPEDPEVLLGTDAVQEARGNLPAALAANFEGLRDSAWPRDAPQPSVDLLIWRDAVARSAHALVRHIDERFGDSRLELPLLWIVMSMTVLIKRAAEAHEWRTLWITILSLGELAENADRPYYREYPADVAGWLIEAGMRAEEHNAEAPMAGENLASLAAGLASRHLPNYCEPKVRDLYSAGIMSPVPQTARWAFVKRLGVRLGSNFGMNFDPVTGADNF